MKTLLFVCLMSFGCAENANEVKLTVPVAQFKTSAGQDKGVGIGAQLITAANVRRFADLNAWLVWYEGDPKQAQAAGAGSGQRAAAQTKRNVYIPLLPLPSAKIRIMNQSGQPISIDHLELALKGSDGKTFPVYRGLAEVQARVTTELLQSQPGLRGAKMNGVIVDKIGKVPYLELKGEIPTGSAATAYVAFDMTSVGDADEYLRSHTLQLVASHLGSVDVLLPLEKKDAELVMICPAGQRAANLDRCRIEGEATDEESQQAAKAAEAAQHEGGGEGGGEGGEN